MTPPVALTIAGSDSGGGAGIQADLKTFAALGVFGTSALTALTAQNTLGVQGVHPVPASFVEAQLDSVLADLPPVAVKTGMLANADILRAVAARAASFRHLVVDPVLVATSGDGLFDASASVYRDYLVPVATVLTPNLAEASALVGRELSTVDDMAAAAAELGAAGARCVVVKGGETAVDVVWTADRVWRLGAAPVSTKNTHGTGCTFAAAVTSYLAWDFELPQALEMAKAYVTKAITGAAAWRLGAGHGPLSWEVPA
jgi:hydroxymethylpyrimidine/phosphomethylpyrimidine kinase